MKHAISSILSAISNARVAMVGGKQCANAVFELPMTLIDSAELRKIIGGDDVGLPKGGW